MRKSKDGGGVRRALTNGNDPGHNIKAKHTGASELHFCERVTV